jgi:hypothetical protein
MVVVMKEDATPGQVESVVAYDKVRVEILAREGIVVK